MSMNKSNSTNNLNKDKYLGFEIKDNKIEVDQNELDNYTHKLIKYNKQNQLEYQDKNKKDDIYKKES